MRVGTVVFTSELLIMLGFLIVEPESHRLHHALLDASVLTVVVGLVLHRWITQPLNLRLSKTMESLREARLIAERLAHTDALTGILNRRAFFDRFEQEWLKSERTGTPLSLLLLDIDFFKTVNDTHGHQAGDAVLIQIARLIESSCRPYDHVGRYGGEEFCIVLANTALGTANDIAERVRAVIATASISHDGCSLPVTVSIGVSQRDAATPDMTDLIESADKALFEAKRSGRNRVCTTLTESNHKERMCHR